MIYRKGILTRADSKKLIDIEFNVSYGVKALILSLDFSPSRLQDRNANKKLVLDSIKEYKSSIDDMGVDLKRYDEHSDQIVDMIVDQIYPIRNLLNFSVYDPGGRFRGRWDVGKRTVVVSERVSSPGMLSGPLYPGKWKLELEVAAVVTDECEYEIKIETKRYDTNPKWVRGHLHVHTYHSDGKNSLDEMVEESKRQGLDFIALTDHNTISGHRDIKEYEDFCVIHGMEFTTHRGHAIALGIREYVDWRTNDNRSMDDIISEVHHLGGLFAVAHPFMLGGVICGGCKWDYTEDDFDYRNVDLLEIWTGSWGKSEIPNELAIRLWNELLDRGLRVVGISGKDWHDKTDNPPDCGVNYILVNELSENAILSSLRAGRIFVSTGPTIDFHATHNGIRYEMGDVIPFQNDEEKVLFHCSVKSEVSFKVSVVKNSKVFLNTRRSHFDFSVTPRGGDWYRMEVYELQSDRPLAISNPIRISPSSP